MFTQLLVISIGVHKKKLLELKIKDNVDHAGPSLQLQPFKVLSLLMERKDSFQNNNWLIAQVNSEIWDAKVDGWILHLITLSSITSITRIIIHMLQRTKNAKRKEANSPFLIMLISMIVLN
jgi:hypothetical protein